jgi:hypothetical protein
MDWFKASVISVLGVIAFSVFHYYVISAPKLERAKIEREIQGRLQEEERNKAEKAAQQSASLAEEQEKKIRETERIRAEIDGQLREHEANVRAREQQEKAVAKSQALQVSLSQCLARADTAYRDRWNSTCSRIGQPANCLLPGPTSTQYDLVRKQDRDDCYTRFSTFQ